MSIAPAPHRRDENSTDSWITPKSLIDRLGPFDLDPCASDPQPWPTAERMITEEEDGMLHLWKGFVWMNPPYGKKLGDWLDRLALHGNGIALTFARTETKAFHRSVWPWARALLFLRGRITFFRPDGSAPKEGHNSGGPSVLIAYGEEAGYRLKRNADLGAVVEPWRLTTPGG